MLSAWLLRLRTTYDNIIQKDWCCRGTDSLQFAEYLDFVPVTFNCHARLDDEPFILEHCVTLR